MEHKSLNLPNQGPRLPAPPCVIFLQKENLAETEILLQGIRLFSRGKPLTIIGGGGRWKLVRFGLTAVEGLGRQDQDQ